MAGAVFDVFCLLLGYGMSRTDLLPPIRALFESSSRGVLVPFGVGFASQPALPKTRILRVLTPELRSDSKKSHYTKKRAQWRTLTDNGKIFAKNAAKFGIFWQNRVQLSSVHSTRCA